MGLWHLYHWYIPKWTSRWPSKWGNQLLLE